MQDRSFVRRVFAYLLLRDLYHSARRALAPEANIITTVLWIAFGLFMAMVALAFIAALIGLLVLG